MMYIEDVAGDRLRRREGTILLCGHSSDLTRSNTAHAPSWKWLACPLFHGSVTWGSGSDFLDCEKTPFICA
jgi:hypothetical protein